MELARARGGGSGRGPFAIDAHRQTHQRRVSQRGLDPTGQHHDAGAGPNRGDAGRAARSGSRCCQRLSAHRDDGPGAGGGQEANAETQAPAAAATGASAGATRARCANAGARRLKRLMLSKAGADR